MKNNKELDTVERMLLETPDITPPAALKEAIAEVRNREAVKAKNLAIERLASIETSLQTAVKELRSVRKTEGAWRVYISTLNITTENYLRTGDWESCYSTMVEAFTTLRKSVRI